MSVIQLNSFTTSTEENTFILPAQGNFSTVPTQSSSVAGRYYTTQVDIDMSQVDRTALKKETISFLEDMKGSPENLQPKSFSVTSKHPGYVLGEQLRNFFDLFYSTVSPLRSFFSIPGAQASALNSYTSPVEANVKLGDISEAIKGIREELQGLSIQDSKWEELVKISKELVGQQGAIIGRLGAGEVITLDGNGQPIVITPENKEVHEDDYCVGTFTPFQRLANSTGGVVGLSRSSGRLPVVIEKLLNHVLPSVQPGEILDIAFVVDTTGSMKEDIAELQRSLLTFLKQLKDEGVEVRVAVLQYQDNDSPYQFTDFATDLDEVEKVVKGIKAKGGRDHPEAVFDALLAAKDKLSWHENTKTRHVAMLIGNALSQPETIDGQYDESSVIEQLQAKGIAFYPVVTQRSILSLRDRIPTDRIY